MSSAIDDLSVALALFAFLFASLEAGFRAGRRAIRAEDASAMSQIGAIQGAVLGMLGLLLAFSFAAAGARFLERQDLIVQEANAIGTAWLLRTCSTSPISRSCAWQSRPTPRTASASSRGVLGRCTRRRSRKSRPCTRGSGAPPCPVSAAGPPPRWRCCRPSTR